MKVAQSQSDSELGLSIVNELSPNEMLAGSGRIEQSVVNDLYEWQTHWMSS